MPPLLQLMPILPIATKPPRQPRLPPLLHLQRNLLIAPAMHKPHYKQQQRNTDPDADADDAACGNGVQFLAVVLYAGVADVGPGPDSFSKDRAGRNFPGGGVEPSGFP